MGKEDESESASYGNVEGSQDSFDDDFGSNEEEEPHGDDDNFDIEAYKKWRAEHPDSEEDPNGEEDDEDFEEEAEEEDSGDY